MYFPDKIMRWFSNSCFLHLLHWFLPLSSWPTWRWTRWLTRWPTWRPTKTSREPFYLKIAYGTLLQEPNDVLRAIQEIEKSREKEAVTIIWIWIQSFLKTFLIPVGIMAFFSSREFSMNLNQDCLTAQWVECITSQSSHVCIVCIVCTLYWVYNWVWSFVTLILDIKTHNMPFFPFSFKSS